MNEVFFPNVKFKGLSKTELTLIKDALSRLNYQSAKVRLFLCTDLDLDESILDKFEKRVSNTLRYDRNGEPFTTGVKLCIGARGVDTWLQAHTGNLDIKLREGDETREQLIEMYKGMGITPTNKIYQGDDPSYLSAYSNTLVPFANQYRELWAKKMIADIKHLLGEN